MVRQRPRVVIGDEAKKSLREAYLYIRKSSLQNAEKIRAKILATIKELPENPNRHSPDKYRLKNEDGSYRAYEVYKYRITYPCIGRRNQDYQDTAYKNKSCGILIAVSLLFISRFLPWLFSFR